MKKQLARTSTDGVKKKVRASEAILVCACEDDEKYTGNSFEGSAPQEGFKKKVIHLPKDREIVFYCSSSQEKSVDDRAEEYADRGSERVMVLGEGLKGWSKAVYPAGNEDLWN
jgi:rhodanese-related sulfurtransferase